MKYLIIDGHYLVHRCMNSPELQVLKTTTDKYVGATYGVIRTLRMLVHQLQPRKVIYVWDGGRSSRRMSIYPQYKVHRDIDKDSEESKMYYGVFQENKSILDRLLPCLGVHTLQLPRREADDVAMKLAKIIEPPNEVILASDDNDYYQAVEGSVTVFRPMAKQWITAENFEIEARVTKERWMLAKCIAGDGSDGIEGIRDVGPVTINKALNEFGGLVSTAQDRHLFYEFCSKSSSKRVRYIHENAKVVERNIHLIDVSYEKFMSVEISQMMEAITDQYPISDVEVMKIFVEMEFQSVLTSFSGWIEPFRLLS